jgi:Mg-chelatase subunit ChlD
MTTTTTTAAVTTTTEAAPLVPTTAAVDRLKGSLAKGSLADLVRSRRRSMMLVDTSGSMNEFTKTRQTKIDALRQTVATIRQSHPVPVAEFNSITQLIEGEYIPNPRGGTQAAKAINFCRAQGATHIVMVTDGQPHDRYEALDAARAFGGPIDVFYIGGAGDYGADFCRELARITGGTCNITDMTAPKELAGNVTKLLGDGSN